MSETPKNYIKDYSFLSKEQISHHINDLRIKGVSNMQVLNEIKSLLLTSTEKNFVLSQLNNIISFSSYDFCELYPVFDQLMDEETSLALPLLKILPSFDYDVDDIERVPSIGNIKNTSANICLPKSLAYKLAMKIGEIVDENGLNDWINFILFSAQKQNIPELYQILNEILTTNGSPQLYLTFENGVRMHLIHFFNVLAQQEKWTFFDFYVFILSYSRPSLRMKISKLFWSSFVTQKIYPSNIVAFFDQKDILSHLFTYISLFLDTILTNPPKYLTLSLTHSFSAILQQIFQSFSEFSMSIVEKLLSYAFAGQNFSSTVSIYTLLNVPVELLSKSVTYLDESVSQITMIQVPVLHAICAIIAHAAQDDMKPLLGISIQKKLLHHSQVLVQTGVSLAYHFIKTDKEFGNEMVKWVLKSMKQNSLLLKPSVLLSVIDLIYETDIDENINSICSFVFNLINSFKVIAVVTLRHMPTKEGSQFAITCSSLDTFQQAELCIEILILVTEIQKRNQNVKISKRNRNILSKDYLQFLESPKTIDFIMPEQFLLYLQGKTDFPKLSASNLKFVLLVKAMIVAYLSRMQLGREDRSELFTLFEKIDYVHKREMQNNRRCLSDIRIESSVLWPSYIFHVLQNESFSFPQDISFCSLLMHCLYSIFVEDVPEHRYFFDNVFSYIENDIPDDIPFIVLTLCVEFLKHAIDCDRSKDQQMIIDYMNCAADGFDFVTLCCSIKQFDINYASVLNEVIENTVDVGIACRVLLIGYHINYNRSILVQTMVNHPFINFVSDLVTNSPIYPTNIPDIDKIVKPQQQGANWRLIIHLSLLQESFDDFYNAFRIILDQINSGSIADEYAYVLCDSLGTRLKEWPDMFESIVELAYLTVQKVLNQDVYSLSTVSSLVENLLTIQPNDHIAPHSGDLWMFIQSKLASFRITGKTRGRMSTSYKKLAMLCQQIVIPPEMEKTAPQQQEENEEDEDENSDGLFNVNSSEYEYDYYYSSTNSEGTDDDESGSDEDEQ